MSAKKVVIKEAPIIYELGRWSHGYMAKRASETTDFYCLKCWEEVHGQSMYEHLHKCSPVFFKSLSRRKDERKKQQYYARWKDGSIVKKTRLVEVDYVDQRGRSGFDPNGISPELQGEVVLSKPGEDQGSLFEDPRSEYVKQKPEQISKVVGRLQDRIEGKEAF